MKYYFAYHIVNGLRWPLRWSEDNGRVVGPDFKTISKVEISEHEFNNEPLTEMVRRYPCKEMSE